VVSFDVDPFEILPYFVIAARARSWVTTARVLLRPKHIPHNLVALVLYPGHLGPILILLVIISVITFNVMT
jgi:hypothetical protein